MATAAAPRCDLLGITYPPPPPFFTPLWLGLVLLAPFNRLKDAFFGHYFSIPLRLFPPFGEFARDSLRESFDSVARLTNVDFPTIIIHGTSDLTVPHVLGRRLYDQVCPVGIGLGCHRWG